MVLLSLCKVKSRIKRHTTIMSIAIDNQEANLVELWAKYDNKEIECLEKSHSKILRNGFCYSKIDCLDNKDILVFGINPSLRINDPNNNKYIFPFEYRNAINDKYYSKIKKRMGEYNDRVNYLDLFCYRDTQQVKINDFLKDDDGILFLVDHLIVTQNLTESLKPKLIIVKNAGARFFFGLDMKQDKKTNQWTKVWMGYEFEDIDGYEGKMEYGYIKRITGVIDDQGRVNQDMETTSLVGTIVIFTTFDSYGRPQPESELIGRLLRIYESKE